MTPRDRRRPLFLVLAAATCLLLAVLSPLASSSPDGLERVATDHGFAAEGPRAWNHAPVADYAMPGIRNEALATGAAGVVGTLLVGAMGIAVGSWLGSRRSGA